MGSEMDDSKDEFRDRMIAQELGLQYTDIRQLSYEIDVDESVDGLPYSNLILISDGPQEILKRISGLEDNNLVRLSPNVFDQPED